MRVKDIVYEDFSNYKKPAMLIGTCFCNWKCCTEMGVSPSICQNEPFVKYPIVDIPDQEIIRRYMENPLTHSIVFGGLEPMEQFDEVLQFIRSFRKASDDDVVIYTGFYPGEIQDHLNELKGYSNIIVKFGRFKLDSKKHLDEVLGVELANEEQFAEKIS